MCLSMGYRRFRRILLGVRRIRRGGCERSALQSASLQHQALQRNLNHAAGRESSSAVSTVSSPSRRIRQNSVCFGLGYSRGREISNEALGGRTTGCKLWLFK